MCQMSPRDALSLVSIEISPSFGFILFYVFSLWVIQVKGLSVLLTLSNPSSVSLVLVSAF